MKKLILLFVSTLFTFSLASANPIFKDNNGDEKCAYCCPKCKKCDSKEGECSKHKCALVKNGTYCCAKCMTTSEVDAKCPKCNKGMKKMDCKKADTKK